MNVLPIVNKVIKSNETSIETDSVLGTCKVIALGTCMTNCPGWSAASSHSYDSTGYATFAPQIKCQGRHY